MKNILFILSIGLMLAACEHSSNDKQNRESSSHRSEYDSDNNEEECSEAMTSNAGVSKGSVIRSCPHHECSKE